MKQLLRQAGINTHIIYTDAPFAESFIHTTVKCGNMVEQDFIENLALVEILLQSLVKGIL